MANQKNHTWNPFKVGDQVWLDNQNLPFPYLSKKLNQRREGPFTIIRKTSPVMYELQLPQKWKIHSKFHASLLTPVVENNIYGKQNPKPPPILISQDDKYKLDAILNH
jgi:hypothetical protein